MPSSGSVGHTNSKFYISTEGEVKGKCKTKGGKCKTKGSRCYHGRNAEREKAAPYLPQKKESPEHLTPEPTPQTGSLGKPSQFDGKHPYPTINT